MEDNPEKTKMIILIAIVSVVVIAIILIAVLAISSSIAASKNNIIIDGVSKKMPESIYSIDETGNIYFVIEQIAPLLSYTFYNGEPGKATEDRTKCYVENTLERATFEMDSNVIYKLILENTGRLYEKYTISNNVKRINNTLYVSLQGIKKAFNVDATYDAEKNVLNIMTLPYLYTQYDNYVKQNGYTQLAEQFSNKKAILNGFLVVLRERELYGVLSTSGETIIGTKYKKLEYIEETNEFLAQSPTDSKYGILTSNSDSAKIDLVYDELKIIDGEAGLYLAKTDNKYGVLKRDGSVLLYNQYEYIGVKDAEAFPNDKIKNPYILFDSVIPVTQNGKIGFYSIDGTEIMGPSRFTVLGCVSQMSSTEAYKNVLVIPESEGAEGVVVGVTNAKNNTLYGIYSLRTKRLLTPTNYSKIYREVLNGEESYKMMFGSNISSVKSHLVTSGSNISGDNATVSLREHTTTTNTIDETPEIDDAITNTVDNTISYSPNTVSTNTNDLVQPTASTDDILLFD